MELQVPKIIGHRGAKAYAPENSFAGLRAAKERGAAWVEVDVMLTRDGVAILHHDYDFKRMARLDKKVAETDWAEAEGLDIGSSFSSAFKGSLIPRLDRAIGLMEELGLGCNFELKPTPGRAVETAEAALPLIQSLWPSRLPAPLISSFTLEALAAAQRVAPDLPRGYLVEGLPRDWRETAERLSCASVHMRGEDISELGLREVKAAGYLALIYTVNDPKAAKRLDRWGADAIITDAPDVIAAALGG
jgi:glycerophosphoryl diester phosphodiesterase